MTGYIKIEKIPEKCKGCKQRKPLPRVTDMWYCVQAGDIIEQEEGRPDFCPILTDEQVLNSLKEGA